MTKDNQQVVPVYNQIGYHHLPYYDSAYETLQPYPYTYQYDGYRYLNPHVFHLPLIYQQYAYHPHLLEQLYPYRTSERLALTPPIHFPPVPPQFITPAELTTLGELTPAAVVGAAPETAAFFPVLGPAFIGLSQVVLGALAAWAAKKGAYSYYLWVKYKDSLLSCHQLTPYRWAEIKSCITSAYQGDPAEVETFVNGVKDLFDIYRKAKKIIPYPGGNWRKKRGILKRTTKLTEKGLEVEGAYDWIDDKGRDRINRDRGVLVGDTVTGTWEDLGPLKGKGSFSETYGFDENGTPIFTGFNMVFNEETGKEEGHFPWSSKEQITEGPATTIV